MAGSTDFTLALKITASATEAVRTVNKLGSDISQKLSQSGSGLGSGLGQALGVLTKISSGFMMILSVAGKLGGILMSAFSTVFSIVEKIASTLLSLPMAGLKLVLAGGAVAAGMVYGAHKALQPASEMEQYRGQLKFQGKESQLPFFMDLALKSRSSLSEVVGAGVYSNNLGLDTTKLLPVLNDINAMMPNMHIDELVRSIGMLNSGRFGEALESLGRVGVTRDVLKGAGIKFGNSGEVEKSSQSRMMATVMNVLQSKFGGAAGKMSGTYGFATSNLGDSISQAFAKGLEKALPYATKIVGIVGGAIDAIGAKFAGINWEGFGSSMVAMVSKASELFSGIDWKGWGQSLVDKGQALANLAGKFLTSEGRQELMDAGKAIWNIISEGLPKVWTAIQIDLKNVLQWGGGRFGLDIKKAIFDGFEVGKTLLATGTESAMIPIFKYLYDILSDVLATLQAIFYNFLNSLPFSGKFMSDRQKEIVAMSPEDQVKALAEPIRTFLGRNVDKPTALSELTTAWEKNVSADEKRLGYGPKKSALWNELDQMGGKIGDAAAPLFGTSGNGNPIPTADVMNQMNELLGIIKSPDSRVQQESAVDTLKNIVVKADNKTMERYLQEIASILRGGSKATYESP